MPLGQGIQVREKTVGIYFTKGFGYKSVRAIGEHPLIDAGPSDYPQLLRGVCMQKESKFWKTVEDNCIVCLKIWLPTEN